MICISVTPSSRRLAPADLVNAAPRCDLIELCLDNFVKTPDVGALKAIAKKPLLVSCRRPEDGGHWKGTEEERIQLLRNSIVAGPEWIELELDIADKIPRFGSTKRVISYTSLDESLNQKKINEVFEQCYKAKADVVKFTWQTLTMDDTWPLLSAVTQSRELPVVGRGIGPSGLTFSLLARKYGSPWIYAALERGMETYPNEPTVWQLQEDYCWDDFDRKTRLIGVVGRGRAENTTSRILNAAFREYDVPIRCLPLLPGPSKNFRRMLEVLKIRALITEPDHSPAVSSIVSDLDESVDASGYKDLLREKDGRWKARATLFQSLNAAATRVRNSEQWAQGRSVLVLGAGSLSASMAAFFIENKAAVSIAAPDDARAMGTASHLGARHVPWGTVYSVMADILAFTDSRLECGSGHGQINPSLLREGQTVIDLIRYPAESELADEARARGCHYVDPSEIFASQLLAQFELLTGKSIPLEAFQKGLADT